MPQIGLSWGRIALGGFLVEAVLIAMTVAVVATIGDWTIVYLGVIGSFVASLVFGLWVARRAPSRHVQHGIMVGVVAVVIYMGLFELGRRFGPPAEPQPWLDHLAGHGLKLVGGALGGSVAERQQRQRDDAGRARAVSARYGG